MTGAPEDPPKTPALAIPEPHPRWLGFAALAFGIVTAIMELVLTISADTVMVDDHFSRLAGPVALMVLTGIVLCIIAGSRGGPSRRLAVIGGVLLLAPLVLFPLVLLLLDG